MNDGISTYMPVTPAYNNGGMGFGDMGSGWWLILLLICLGGGWNGGFGFGGGNGMGPMMVNNDVQRGFDQSAVISGINGIQSTLSSGFANTNSAIANGFAQAEIAANGRQMADMNQNFAIQTGMLTGFNGLQSQLASCCCENRLATANQTATILAEHCSDRQALSDGVRDIITNQTMGIQRVLDVICQDKLDAKNEQILALQNQVNMQNLAASQLAQTQQILAAITPAAVAKTTTAA